MRRKFFLATALVAVAATAGAGIVFAAGAISQRGGPAAASTTGGGTGSGCGTAWQTRTGQVLAPIWDGDDMDVLTPVSSVTLVKKCSGSAIATFSTELLTVGVLDEVGIQSHDDLDVVLRATCTHTAGSFPTCHPGQRVYGGPGGEDDPVFMEDNLSEEGEEYTVRSMQWAFASLPPGTWRVDVLAGHEFDDSSAQTALEFRTLFVQTL